MIAFNKEQKLIAKIKAMVDVNGQFIGDDSAVLPGDLLATTDSLVESTHFNLNWTALGELGWKAMAVNLSDIAAMAGIPKYALVGLSIPEELSREEKLISLYEGFNDCAQYYKTAIVGGDIVRAPQLCINITIIGQTNEKGVLLRSGAKADDVVLVTGDFGASHAGLLLSKSLTKDSLIRYKHCLREFLKPTPKFNEAWQLVERVGSRGALMDTSDGLADALLQVSSLSKIGMAIDLSKIPIADATRQYAEQSKADPVDFALYGGEDYQLLACLAADEWDKWQKEKPEILKSFTTIGKVTDSGSLQLTFGNEKEYKLDPERIFKHIS